MISSSWKSLALTAQGLLASLLVLATTLLLYQFPARLFFDLSLQGFRPYGLAYVAVIALLTLLGGRRMGLVTLSLAAVGALYLLPPRSNIGVGDGCGWAEFGALLLLGGVAVLGTSRLFARSDVTRGEPTVPQGEPSHGVRDAAPVKTGLREVTEWWAEIGGASRSWLILGKGPSFDTRDQYDLSPYTTIAVNHVVREMPVFATSAVNYDVIGDCGEAIYQNSRYLLMPRYPHSIPGDSDKILEDFFTTYPVLERLSREGRLIWYNLSSDPLVPGSPVVLNGPFSVCILFSLLGKLGARHLRTLGVDGGLNYGASFRDIADRTRLANGMPSYDRQFKDIMDAVRRYGLDYAPLNADDRRLRRLALWHLFRHYTRFDPTRALRHRRQGLPEHVRRA